MANPYKKAEQMKKVAPGSRPVVEQKQPEQPKIIEEKVQPVVPVVPVVEEKLPEVIAPVVEETPAEPEKENTIIELGEKDPFAGLVVEKKQRGKSYGFYLDDEVVAALEKLAKQKKSNKSKVLNTLLRNILLK